MTGKQIIGMADYLLRGIILAALLFAAGFAYHSNAELAVIKKMLDTGLQELKECRAIADINTTSIAVMQQRVASVEEKVRRGNL